MWHLDSESDKGMGGSTYVGFVRFCSILYTEDKGEVEDRRDTTSMNVVWRIQ